MGAVTASAARALVDTDVLIGAARGMSVALDCLRSIERVARIAVSTVTQMELIIGCRSAAELRTLDRFLRRFDVVELNEAVSRRAVELLRRYRLSHGPLIADALIAATAMAPGLPLVSKNQRDFRFIAGLDLRPYPQPFP